MSKDADLLRGVAAAGDGAPVPEMPGWFELGHRRARLALELLDRARALGAEWTLAEARAEAERLLPEGDAQPLAAWSDAWNPDDER